MILGTAAYMTSRAGEGREADKRSDIWAFGCVLFEMLTGNRPFEGLRHDDGSYCTRARAGALVGRCTDVDARQRTGLNAPLSY